MVAIALCFACWIVSCRFVVLFHLISSIDVRHVHFVDAARPLQLTAALRSKCQKPCDIGGAILETGILDFMYFPFLRSSKSQGSLGLGKKMLFFLHQKFGKHVFPLNGNLRFLLIPKTASMCHISFNLKNESDVFFFHFLVVFFFES